MDRFVTVTAIHSAAGTVTIRQNGTTEPIELKLSFNSDQTTAQERALNLQGVHPTTLLNIYQMLSRRTVLRGPGIPVVNLNVVTAPEATGSDALAAITNALATNDVTLQNAGDTFAFAVLNGQADALSAIPTPPPGSSGTRTDIAAQMMNFQDIDLLQGVEIYQELADRTALRSPFLPSKTRQRSLARAFGYVKLCSNCTGSPRCRKVTSSSCSRRLNKPIRCHNSIHSVRCAILMNRLRQRR
jgi:hypothetical protein